MKAIDSQSIRGRFQRAMAGELIEWPVYAVYDWFVVHRPIDWPSLFVQGLGQINHANLVDIERPNLQIVENTQQTERGLRRDVRWITDRGELHEWYLGEWRQEYLVKTPEDYRILCRALEGTRFTATDEVFQRSEAALGDGGITVGHLMRTPLMEVQVVLCKQIRQMVRDAESTRFCLMISEDVPPAWEQTVPLVLETIRSPGRNRV